MTAKILPIRIILQHAFTSRFSNACVKSFSRDQEAELLYLCCCLLRRHIFPKVVALIHPYYFSKTLQGLPWWLRRYLPSVWESWVQSLGWEDSLEKGMAGYPLLYSWGFPGGSDGKESACKVGDLGLILGLGRSAGEENGYPLQNSCLENSMDGGAWRATVHGVEKSWTRLSDSHFHIL